MTSIFTWSSATFDKLFEKATSHLLLEPDWESILQICDSIRQGDVQPKYVLACIKKKLYHQNPHVVLYTLQVLESCMKNCGSPFHVEVASRPFMEELKELVKTTTNDNIRSRILELIQIWAHAFRNEPKYRAVQDIFNMLKVEGFKLQVLKESDAMFVADTAPDWADGSCCHRCRTQFTVVLRKHHCRNCGQIFCGKCSSKSCPIPRFGIEKDVRVCDSCWEKLNRASSAKSSAPNPEQIPNFLTKPSSAKSSAPNPEQSPQTKASEDPTSNRKSELELKEEEDLQLAIALSQSEAESKEVKKQQKSILKQPAYTVYSAPEEIMSEKKTSPVDSELDHYLNRSYWEQRQQQQKEDPSSTNDTRHSPTPTAPAPASISSAPAVYTTSRTTEKYQNGDSDELNEFQSNLQTTVEIFINRMKSNASRGRPIANDTHVQSLFMNITNMHSQLLKYMQEQEDLRAYYERLQDKLNQARDARAALDALREEHREKLRLEAEEAERQRQIQMAYKLDIMRKKKQEYLQYQRQLAMQKMQEQEREMQMRQEQQKQQYQVVQPGPGLPPQGPYPPQHAYGPPPSQTYAPPMPMPNGIGAEMPPQQAYHPNFKPPQLPPEYHQPYNMQMPPQSYPQQPSSVPMGPQMMMPPPPHMTMMPPQGVTTQPPMMQQSQPITSVANNLPQSPQHQAPPPPEPQCDPLIVFD